MDSAMSVSLNFALKNTQSVSELWVSVHQLAEGLVKDNAELDNYPMDTREAQLTTLKALVTALENTHTKARAELTPTPDYHFEHFSFENRCSSVLKDRGAWDDLGKFFVRSVTLEELGTGRAVKGNFVVNYRDNWMGEAYLIEDVEQ